MQSLLFLAFIDFFIQILGFVLAYTLQTEKFYDFTGSATYIILVQLSFRWKIKPNSKQTLLVYLVSIWAFRLGSFLFYRVLSSGGDRRFDKVKVKPLTFFIYWMIQGLWIFITLLPTLICLNHEAETKRKSLVTLDYIGLFMWILGFAVEIIADYQKLVFKNDPDNVEKFIDSGLWSLSRHPNYFGEIVLWCGVFLLAASTLQGWEWLSIISPIFVYYLLNYVSGIPILERSSMKRFGHLEAYKHYVNTVPVLVPFFGQT